jgi:hypothetical protein
MAAWYLNELGGRHGLPSVAAIDPNAGRRVLVMHLEELGDGGLRLNVARAKEAIEFQAPSVWDLQLHVGDRIFIGRWEDVPDQSAATYDFHPASPPPWLSEQIPAA